MKSPLQTILVFYAVVVSYMAGALRSPLDQPNIIIFLADDFGYGDLSSYGHPTQEFGPIDQMGREGIRFTQWYAPALFCSPSRGAMLTGRYPVRVGLYGDHQQPYPVFVSQSSTGLPKEEITIAEALKSCGYATGMVGKWHLGINEFNSTDGNHLPMHHGFDFVGTILPFSNVWRCDLTKAYFSGGPSMLQNSLHISTELPSVDPKQFRELRLSETIGGLVVVGKGRNKDHLYPLKGAKLSRLLPSVDRSSCFLYYNDTMLQQPFSHHNLTSAMLLDAKAFIYDHQHEPFFFYFSFPHTHSNMFSSTAFRNSSRRGFYGDNINEMSWAVGEMLQLLRDLNLERNTLAIFLSDHGPEREMCKEAGVSGPLKGSKGVTWEGGVRVPSIAWWPGTIPADVTNHEVISSMDLFSLAVDLAGGSLPTDRIIDGRSIKEVLLHGGRSPHQALFHYCGKRIMAVRHGRYKMHYHTQEVLTDEALSALCRPRRVPNRMGTFHCGVCFGACVTTHDPPLLFDLDEDPEEAYPLPVEKHVEILDEVDRLVSEHQAGMVHGLPLFNDEYMGSPVIPCCNPPYCFCRANYYSKNCF